jgi:lycopene beta-cyclase
MARTKADIVIVGGGLSGLTLALHLCAPQYAGLQVLVLEQRTSYERDRTWSYWGHNADTPHLYSHLERKAWHSWSVAHERSLRMKATGWTYRSIDADSVYQHVLSRIGGSERVQLVLGVRDLDIPAPSTGGAQLQWRDAQGDTHTCDAARIFDARGRIPLAAPNAAEPHFAQHFLGWELKADTDVFDPDCVELMHFQPCALGLHFQYLLPYSPRQALLEDTWISRADLQVDYAAQLQATLAKRWPRARFQTVFSERGHLRLTNPRLAAPESLGTAAGALRPATGYAFGATLAHCAQVAQALAQTSTQTPTTVLPRPATAHTADAWMDAVLFRALEQDWLQAPGYFLQLFERCDTHALLQFLRGPATWGQRLQVMAALPAAPFARAALARARVPAPAPCAEQRRA